MRQEILPLLYFLLVLVTFPVPLVRGAETRGAAGGAAAYMQRLSRGYPPASNTASTKVPGPSYAAVNKDSGEGQTAPPVVTEQRNIGQQDTWSELMNKMSDLIRTVLDPYVSFFENYPLHLGDTLDTLRSAVANSRIAENPALAAAMGTAAVALPLVFQVTRSLLENTVSLLDNSMFVVTGHALGRRSLEEDVYDEIAEILLRVVNLITRHLGK
ncbi:uncharacterized protein [Procambarus clarkii]|uniref:uncharacterized protein n=1 Tax=Procambarus clarkii TaxID=6728 RepID=UPI0037426906